MPSTPETAAMSMPQAKPQPRLGPQPLPLHLSLALTSWSNSAAILPGFMLAWQHYKAQQAAVQNQPANQSAESALPASLLAALKNLGPQLEAADQLDLARALTEEGHRRLDAFLTGTLAYRRQPQPSSRLSRPVLWSKGSTRLLDYRQPSMTEAQRQQAPRVLVIPSLINRYYILDLAPDASFLDFLADAGCQPFVIDWDAPGEEERNFTLSDYIAGRLQEAYLALAAEPGGPIFIVGYCMGGLLALALTQLLLQSNDKPSPAGLVLLATPWDFHAEQTEQAEMLAAIARQLEPVMSALGELPVDLLQSFFALLDPFQVPRKFQAFAALHLAEPSTSDAVRRFTQLEDWLNDGVGLAAPVARECLLDWYGTNSTKRRSWRIGDQAINPCTITLPCLALIPDKDRIVPPGSALSLAEALPHHDIERPSLGHIGMMAGSKAKVIVWPRIVQWINEKARDAVV